MPLSFRLLRKKIMRLLENPGLVPLSYFTFTLVKRAEFVTNRHLSLSLSFIADSQSQSQVVRQASGPRAKHAGWLPRYVYQIALAFRSNRNQSPKVARQERNVRGTTNIPDMNNLQPISYLLR